MVRIREYDPASDFPALRACFVELQSFERRLEPARPEPEAIADAYLAAMLARCKRTDGRVFLAETDGATVGFACVMARVEPELDESLEPYAYISDLVVMSAHRGRGIGRQLIAQVEAFVRNMDIGRLKIGALVRNPAAHRLYRDCGFEDYSVQLVKPLRVLTRES
jgi:GNAT superfamily N-acetyltransferase